MNKSFEDRLNDFINSHPRESLFVVVLVLMIVWQTIPAILCLLAFVLINRVFKLNPWIVSGVGLLFFIEAVYVSQESLSGFAIKSFFKNGFHYNREVWRLLIANHPFGALVYSFKQASEYLFGAPILSSCVLGLIDLIPSSPHEVKMKALQKGMLDSQDNVVSEKLLKKALAKLSDHTADGIVLGVSTESAKPVIIPDRFINQVGLVLGTTGSGKTVTLQRFYKRAIIKGYPLIIVDGKPDEKNIEWIQQLAAQHGRRFIGFNCANYYSYDSLAHGNYTELKDKIICLKDHWENDYYRSIAEDYLQTSFEVLLKHGDELNLKKVVNCLNYMQLKLLASATKDDELIERVKELKNYERKDITGLQAHLNILINSELGQYFNNSEKMFSLTDVLNEQSVVYFALPALRFPSFAKVLGKLVINDIKAVIDRKRNYNGPIFTIFDEFSVFAGDQVLNLVNMGRGKGIHALFGTQGLADLDKVDVSFKAQMLNCVNTLICHRLNDQESAEAVANWVGTKDAFTLTAQLNMKETDGGMGSVRVNKEYIVHPDAIKQGLGVGEAFYVSKVGGFVRERVRVLN